ncbi:MAG TPA: hypothetical protein VKY92_25880 [Verrucomicrobiae bacterium]|nr:hypothetical protein [Verrucomicrobiae bacterium]
MKLLVVAVNDKGICLGIDPDDDFYVGRVEKAEDLLGTVAELEPQDCCVFDTLATAVEALRMAGGARSIRTSRRCHDVSHPDLVRRIANDIFGEP